MKGRFTREMGGCCWKVQPNNALLYIHLSKMNTYAFPLENNLVVFRPGITGLFILNETAGMIWKSYSDQLHPGEIAARIAEQFQLSKEDARKDVEQTISYWVAHGLVDTGSEKTSFRENIPAPSVIHPFSSHGLSIKSFFSQHTYSLFNKSFVIGFETLDLKNAIHPLLFQFETVSNATTKVRIDIFSNEGAYFIARNGKIVGENAAMHETVGLVLKELFNILHPEMEWMAVLHGAAVGSDGHGILFPGEGGNGKSTLVAALSRSGFSYLNDDTVPLDAWTQHAAAVPLSICLKEGSWTTLQSYYPEIDTLPVYERYGKRVRYLPSEGNSIIKGIHHLPIKIIVFPSYRKDGENSLEKISKTDALQRIVQSGVWVSPNPEHVGRFIGWIRSLSCYRLSYNLLAQGIQKIVELTTNERI